MVLAQALPAKQAVHEAAPASAYVPAGQEYGIRNTLLQAYPAGHVEHDVDPSTEKDPDAHTTGATEVLLHENPGGHFCKRGYTYRD